MIRFCFINRDVVLWVLFVGCFLIVVFCLSLIQNPNISPAPSDEEAIVLCCSCTSDLWTSSLVFLLAGDVPPAASGAARGAVAELEMPEGALNGYVGTSALLFHLCGS